MRLTISSGEGAGTSFEPHGERFVLGRDDSCDVVLDDEEVSRRHAALSALPGGRFRIEDLGSRTGTFVDGERISEPVELHGGEALTIGRTAIDVEAPATAAETQVTATPPAGAPATEESAVPVPPPAPPPAPARVAPSAPAPEPAAAPAASPAAPVTASDSGRAGGGWRAAAAAYAVIFGLFAVGFVVVGIDGASEALCNAGPTLPPGEEKCLVDSAAHRDVAVGLALGAGMAGLVSAGFALAFTITGLRWKRIFVALGAALILYALFIAVGLTELKIPGAALDAIAS